jgi:hypothetical protein
MYRRCYIRRDPRGLGVPLMLRGALIAADAHRFSQPSASLYIVIHPFSK